MKAKILFTALFFLSFLQNTFAQEYHPFLNNSSWVISRGTSCCLPAVLRVIEEGSDIVIGPYIYKQFTDPFPSSDIDNNSINTVYIREVVDERKVYRLVNGTDILIYDFSLENENSISQYGYTWIATVDQIEAADGTRKRITLNSVEQYHNHTLTQVWIEGIGSDAHPFYPDRNSYIINAAGGGWRVHTSCCFQNGLRVYGNSNCESLLPTQSQVYFNQKITFSPNPFTTQLTINSETALQDADFKLYTVQGQLVSEKNFHGTNATVSREKLSAGSYFAQLFEKGKLVKVEKLMVN